MRFWLILAGIFALVSGFCGYLLSDAYITAMDFDRSQIVGMAAVCAAYGVLAVVAIWVAVRLVKAIGTTLRKR
jgi:uncharacterized membrane-anchored protein